MIKVHLVVGREDIDVIPHIRIPVIYPNNLSWGGVDCSYYGRRYVHDIVQFELDGMILEEVQDLVGVLDDGGYSILFPPFGGLGDEVPPLLPFLRLYLERFVVIQVDGGGICDGLGRDGD